MKTTTIATSSASGIVIAAIGSKSSFHFKQSPNTSRVTTPNPHHSLSSVIKFEAGYEATTDNNNKRKDKQGQQPQHLTRDQDYDEPAEKEAERAKKTIVNYDDIDDDGNDNDEVDDNNDNGGGNNDDNDDDDDGDDDDDDDEQPCDLRLRRSLKIMSMALQQAAAAAAASGVSSDVVIAAEQATPNAATTAAAMAVMIGGSVSAAVPTTTTSNLQPAHAHTVLPNFPPPALAPRSVTSLLPSAALPSNMDITSTVGGGSVLVTLTTTTTVTTTSSSTAVSTIGNTAVNIVSGIGGNNASGGGGGGGSWGGAYTCERCGNSYARPHSLNRHVRFECGVEPKFECPICHKKSKHKHNLVLHMRTHQHR